MKRNRGSILFLTLLLSITLAFAHPAISIETLPTDLTGIKVAVYEGVTDEQSSSLSSRTALFWMFRWMNATVDVVTAADIRNDILVDYDIIAIPGGWAWAYFQDLTNSGIVRVRNFVENGGAFFGVCAGAYFACDNIRWEGENIGYSLDLYPNLGIGPIEEIAAWPGHNMTRINLNKAVTGPDLSGEPDSHTVMYYGGPYFETAGTDGVNVIATYEVNGEPAIISYEYGQGRIVLSGPHVEWEEDADRDGVVWENVYDDEGSEWDMMLQIGLWLSENGFETATTSSTTTSFSTTTANSSPTLPPMEIDPALGLVAILAIFMIAVIADRLRR
ncbi:MAG: BPL-N domain-containing protein [Candidatus Thorarchaeota archaeon]